MNRFYGTIEGESETKAARTGSLNSGLTTYTAGWQGAVRVSIYADGDRDMVDVAFVPWHGKGISEGIFNGPVDGKER